MASQCKSASQGHSQEHRLTAAQSRLVVDRVAIESSDQMAAADVVLR